MREIKYRAWLKQRCKMLMVEELVFYADGDIFGVLVDVYQQFKYGGFQAGAEFELMQFTGWLDKKGREIYEGDIVQMGMSCGVVEWDTVTDGWRIRLNNQMLLRIRDMTVIGNMREHPELLEGRRTVILP